MSRGKSRERLLEEGLSLFGARGYAATGVQDITDAAGVPKGSFYNYFESKEDFAVAVLDLYRERAAEHSALLASQEIPSPLGRLSAFLEAAEKQLAESGFAGGCLAGRLAQELAGEQVRFRAPLCQVFGAIQQGVERCLLEAQQVGELAANDDPALLASFLVNAWQGAMLRAKAAGSVEPLVAVRTVVFGRLLLPAAESSPSK